MGKKKKDSRGGKRTGSGRKGIYGEPTELVGFKCPVSKVTEFKKHGRDKLKQWEINKPTK